MVGADASGENFNFKPSRMAKNGFPRITPLSQDLLHFVDHQQWSVTFYLIN